MIAFLGLLDWVFRLVLTAVVVIWLRFAIEPYLPVGEWHAMLTGLFLCVLWPLSVWSLRSVRLIEASDLYTLWWW
jgi:hypothetical protein